MTDTTLTTPNERLFHLEMGGKNVLFSADPDHPHYLKISFHFPYRGLEADFFDENARISSDSGKNVMEFMATNITWTMKDVLEKFSQIPAQERARMAETEAVEEKLTFFLENSCMTYVAKHWGKMLRKSATELIRSYLASGDMPLQEQNELHFDAAYRQLIDRFGECRSLNHCPPPETDLFWLKKMEGDEIYGNVTFKKLNCGYSRNSIPDFRTVTVGFDEFTKEESGFLPLFIGTEYGLVPKTTPVLWKALEGQTVALLEKSAVTGYERQLKICEVHCGQFVPVRAFLNSAEKELLNPTERRLEEESETFIPSEIVYRYVHGGKTYLAMKEDNLVGTGFKLSMLSPYRFVFWDYDAMRPLPEQEKQEIIPQILTLMYKLYFMAEINAANWQKAYGKYRAHNIHHSEAFNFDFFLEYKYESLVSNSTLFPDHLCGSYAKHCFKAILREILATGTFKYAENISEAGYSFMLKAGSRTVIDVTPYTEEERKEQFETLTNRQKANLFAAMQEGYGSQFDRLVTKWMRNGQ